MRHEIHANITMMNRSDNSAKTVRYNEHETKNNDDVQYNFRNNSTNDVHEDNDSTTDFHAYSMNGEGGNRMPSELRENSMKADDESNSTSHESCGNLIQVEDNSNLTSYELLGKYYQDDNKRNVVPYEMCENSTCIPLCCPLGSFFREICDPGNVNYPFPDVYEYVDVNESWPIGKKLDQIFQLTVHDPLLCKINGRFVLTPEADPNDEYMFFVNGSLYWPYKNVFIESYCLAALQDKYEITVCFEFKDEIFPEVESGYLGYPVGLIISLPFLLTTFVVYSIVPELWNMHGYTLRAYVGSLFSAYLFLVVVQLDNQNVISNTVCILLGIAYDNNVMYIHIYYY